jgi:hypothetical protein
LPLTLPSPFLVVIPEARSLPSAPCRSPIPSAISIIRMPHPVQR